MIRLAIPNAVLNVLSSNLSAICAEARIRLHPEDGISTTAVDPAFCSLVNLRIPTSAFLNYDIGSDTEIEIGVDVIELKKIVKLCSSEVIGIVGEPTGPLTFIEGNKKLSMKLIALDTLSKSPRSPVVETKVEFTVPGKVFYDVITSVKTMNDKVMFVCPTDQSVDVVGRESKDEENIRFHWNHGDEIEITKPPAEEVLGVYSTDYLKDIAAAWRGADSVTVGFGYNIPIVFSTTLDLDSTVYNMVAPRIESD